MWRIPLSLIAGGADVNITITSDTLVGNLWTFLGSPSGPQTVTVVVDGADAGNIDVTADWAGGSTFQFTAINGGRIIGIGGGGGDGGNDLGAVGDPGTPGSNGGAAISTDGFALNIDIDAGFLLGGGGGGGGGGFDDQGTSGTPGGGGGGGIGFGVSDGGAAGTSIGFPLADPGGDGSSSSQGSGGEGGTTNTNNGGTGGGWGSGGATGQFAGTGFNTDEYGGGGGRAGMAFFESNGGTIVYNGVKTEATLRTESRLIGETNGYANIPGFAVIVGGSMSAFTLEWTFENDSLGTLSAFSSLSGTTNRTDSWHVNGTPVVADYEVRVLANTTQGVWDIAAAADGTWIALGSPRAWSIFDSAFRTVGSIFEIRRTGSAADVILDSGYLSVDMEDGS